MFKSLCLADRELKCCTGMLERKIYSIGFLLTLCVKPLRLPFGNKQVHLLTRQFIYFKIQRLFITIIIVRVA